MMRLSRSLLLCAMGAVLVGCGGGGGGTSETGGSGGSPAAGANGAAGNGARGGAGGGQVGTGGAAGATSGIGGQGGVAGSGIAGSNGTSGGAGNGGGAGASGAAGSGAAGASGAAGTSGAAGSTGGAGTSGAAGAAGTAGSSGGTAGATGNAGSGGGAAGVSGSGGAAGGGAAGTSGSAGAGGGAGAGASGAGGGGQAGAGGAAGGAGSAGPGGTTGSAGSTGSGGSGSCQAQQGLSFVPRTPTVLIFVDRGGTEFTTATTGPFFNVKTAVEGAIANVEAQYRLGLAVYVGDHSSGSCQLNYDSVPIAVNNAFAIDAGYEALGPLQPYTTAKADTPAVDAIPLAQTALTSDPGNGGKYLLFITGSLVDFCDDSLEDCSADAVTGQIQQMYAGTPSIGTLVVGLPVNASGGAQVLANFANAGAGQPVFALDGSALNLYSECEAGGPAGWRTMLAATGKTGKVPIANYSSAVGTASVFMSASGSATDIETAVNAALAAAKSCTFDVATFSIDPSKLGEGTVTLGGLKVPQDGSIGWSMPTPTELVLNGYACSIWRQPNAAISFSFPCDAILTN